MVNTETGTLHRHVELGWPLRLLGSFAFAGLLAIMAAVSFPLPWTPVPFSMMPLALMVAGAYQRPGWAGLSVLVYLAAGAVGAPIFADGAGGIRHLVGTTAGYLWGFLLLGLFVSWYMQAPRRLMTTRWMVACGTMLGLLVLGGVTAIARFADTGGLAGYGATYADWGIGRSVLWVLLFFTATATAATVWSLRRRRGESVQALNLFFVMIAGVGVLHLCGVVGLIVGGMAPLAAVVLGSVVFLPFDIIKAGLAVGLCLPFLPAPNPRSHA